MLSVNRRFNLLLHPSPLLLQPPPLTHQTIAVLMSVKWNVFCRRECVKVNVSMTSNSWVFLLSIILGNRKKISWTLAWLRLFYNQKAQNVEPNQHQLKNMGVASLSDSPPQRTASPLNDTHIKARDYSHFHDLNCTTGLADTIYRRLLANWLLHRNKILLLSFCHRWWFIRSLMLNFLIRVQAWVIVLSVWLKTYQFCVVVILVL